MTAFITCPTFAPPVKHAFFTRQLEGSSHNYFEMANRDIAMRHLEISGNDLCIVKQEHTTKVETVSTNWDINNTPIADAMVTDVPGLALGILTADCTPLLFADTKTGIIGAAHAGWKGARHGIVENTLLAMEQKGTNLADITVAIGPCIQQYSYETGPEFYENFLSESQENARFFIPSTKAGHFMFDMPAYVTAKLKKCGITAISNVNRDTCSDEEHFFSYRRTCLQGGIYRKNGLSVIALCKDI